MSSVVTDYGKNTSTSYLREQAEKEAVSSGKVTHNDFLKLLTKQLTTQDPLNPMQDLDFTAQLAQLQALDEQMAMTKSMQAMRIDSQLQAGTAMIGKFVSGTDDADAQASGMVKRVMQKDGAVYVELNNEQRIPVSNITNVWNDANSMLQELANSGSVIDMWVEAGIDPETKQAIRGIVERVQVVDGQIQLKLYGGETVTWDQVTELRLPTSDEIYHFLPDEVRLQVEKAGSMKYAHVTGVDETGKKTAGIVQGAELDEKTKKVYLVLYSGERIDMDNLVEDTDSDNDPRIPTADEAKKYLEGLWAIGLDDKANEIGGLIADAVQNEDGLALVLHDGKVIYWDSIGNIREATDEEYADATGKESGEGEG